MEVLTPVQLKRLDQHKYSSSGSSLVEPVLQVYWRWLVELFPRWVAPNAITVAGLIVNFISSVLLMVYCPTATEIAPRWIYIFNGVALFIYQSLDAIDGKQARRTNSSTPLGELFDHGCDSVSTALVACAICVSMRLGYHTWVMCFVCLSSYVTFYFGHWASYVTGTLSFGLIDVTEVQLSSIGIFLLTGMFGPEIWSAPVPILGYPLHAGPILFIALGTTATYIRFSRLILAGGCGENGATIADTSVLSPGINMAIVVVFALSIASQSKTFLVQLHPVLYLIFIGLVSAKVTNRLVVAHMTRSELKILDTSLIGLLLLFLNQYFGSYINEHLLLWVCFIHSCVDLTQYLTHTYNEIANHLNIYVFSLRPRTTKQK
uniref:diacylglycerol cholinephosphotransferase n=1 Tax=Phallusia mammillata TaxID=59560 RepID=A0A6F9D8D4_9ASCI|nr:choline/ethanolaminephosphotransferase 1-like [Phallusia mammillata]